MHQTRPRSYSQWFIRHGVNALRASLKHRNRLEAERAATNMYIGLLVVTTKFPGIQEVGGGENEKLLLRWEIPKGSRD